MGNQRNAGGNRPTKHRGTEGKPANAGAQKKAGVQRGEAVRGETARGKTAWGESARGEAGAPREDKRRGGDNRRNGDNQQNGDTRRSEGSYRGGENRQNAENRRSEGGYRGGDKRQSGENRWNGEYRRKESSYRSENVTDSENISSNSRGPKNDTREIEREKRNTDVRGPQNKEQTQRNDGRRAVRKDAAPSAAKSLCPVNKQCGGCQMIHLPYREQLVVKQKMMQQLLGKICPVKPIIGMENPYHYRNKVHAVFDHDKKGNPISGVYKEGTHIVVPVEKCMIEDEKADEIIGTIRGMLRSFKIRTFDEDTGFGLMRHVLIRRGLISGEIMVVLVTSSPIFPSKKNFVKALLEKHPEITTIVQNVNGKNTNMVLGDKEQLLYGKGYIEDELCGLRFRISPRSFYQVNPVQTEVLYNKAIELAGLTGKETVLDAYCGVGTIGLIASRKAAQVIGVELNREAVRDAAFNAKLNGIENAQFYCNDAGKFMVNMAERGETVDVVLMDPPRSGSTKEFIDAVALMGPKKVVYVSCGPETLARDLKMFYMNGYRAMGAWPVDMFPWTGHVETVVLLERKVR